MAKLSDTKIPITEFLEAYRRQPCLYNTLLGTYKNRVSREDAYKAIIKSLKNPQLTVMDIKLKIKSVRTVYSKELRIWMREKEMGRSYAPKLFWFKLADSFLRSVSLSNGKRMKTKAINPKLDTNQTAVKKEDSTLITSRKLLFNNSGDISMSEDTMEAEDQELDEEPLDAEPVESIDDEIEGIRALESQSQGNVSAVVNASDLERPSAIEGSTATGKTEISIDDSGFCVVEQQQQHQQQQHHQQQQQQQQHHHQQQQLQPTPRKLKLSTQGTGQNQLTHDSSTPPSASASASAFPVGGEDNLVIFGQSVASQLRTITDSYSRSVAKLRIQQVLFEAETGQFQNSASQDTISAHLHTF
ncbi:AT-rich binding protein [Drosophila willistoni]|uniref:AT-rich binding protein n=1 Tax=Drosophila willistoni TaxID=7260 RepID=UPI001F0864B5|nr:AT-rich binding protein [Drosophila willistoni]